MSPTRRDVLKIASALGLAGALPSTAERVAAIHLLDQEVSPKQVLDPATFASEVDGILGGKLDDEWLMAINPTQHAAYARAVEDVRREVAILDTKEAYRLYGDWEAAVFNYIMGSYSAGIRHGAAYENLRRAVVGEVVHCRDCWGVGATKHRDVCAACGGSGTVTLRA